jgi:hypothetical protein
MPDMVRSGRIFNLAEDSLHSPTAKLKLSYTDLISSVRISFAGSRQTRHFVLQICRIGFSFSYVTVIAVTRRMPGRRKRNFSRVEGNEKQSSEQSS